MAEASAVDARQQIALKVQYLLHPGLYADPEAPTLPDVIEGGDEATADAFDAADSPVATDVPVATDLAVEAKDAPAADAIGPLPDAPSKGTGGCAASGRGDPSGGMLLSIAVLAFALAHRRRAT